MDLTLYAHPFSSYCQKVLTALYENATPFRMRILGEDADAQREFEARSPFAKMPLLDDAGRTLLESTVIIEHLSLHHPGPGALIPPPGDAALDVRFMDRSFDLYVITPMQRIVAEALRPADRRDPHGVAEARKLLDTAYAWLDERMADREWASAAGFSLADCAAAPALFYADWAHPIDPSRTHLLAYRRRLLARPSFARAVDEARRYRGYFPLGAPDRD